MRPMFVITFLTMFLMLLWLLFRIWLEGKHQDTEPPIGNTPPEEIPKALREAALHPLERLTFHYTMRDEEKVYACISETMLPETILIQGLQPQKLYYGWEGARAHLQDCWAYWGQVFLNPLCAELYKTGDMLYFILCGSVKLDMCRLDLPVKATGILEEKDGQWYISKLQWMYDLNYDLVILIWLPVLAMIFLLLIYGVCLLFGRA